MWAEQGTDNRNSPRQGEEVDQIRGPSGRKGCRQEHLQQVLLRQGLGTWGKQIADNKLFKALQAKFAKPLAKELYL